MARVRKIRTTPTLARPNYFLVDACFLANKYILIGSAPTPDEKDRLRECKKWWKEIDRQVDAKRARVYIPDICIAESFKVLAKKYYQESMLTWKEWKDAREALESDVRTPSKTLKSQMRHIRYHDMPATRDIIIAVDGNKIEDYDDLRNELDRYKVGETVNLIIIREEQPLEIKVDLEEVS